MTEVLDFLKGFNAQTIVSLGLIVWFFFSNLKSEIKLLEAKIDRQSERTDKIYEMFVEIRRDFYEHRKEVDQKFYDTLKEKKA